MSRPLRLEFPGALYHITARGNGRENIYIDDADRHQFISILSNTVQRYNWICHAFCLMNNHYHLLIETVDTTLSMGMRQLNGMYTQRFNRNHNRVGHVFQGRFKSIIVEKNFHLLELSRYIILNPVKAGIVDSPQQWEWSSYNSTVLKNRFKDFLTVEWLLVQFASNVETAKRKYSDFIIDGLGREQKSPWDKLRGQVFLGSKEFVFKMQQQIMHKQNVKEIPKTQRFASRPSLHEIFKEHLSKEERNKLIVDAHLQYGYTLKSIGDHLAIHYSTVSRVINKSNA